MRLHLLYLLLLFTTAWCSTAQAQSTGQPVLNIDFGQGEPKTGYPLPVDKSQFTFTLDSCTSPGNYTITNSLIRCPFNRFGRSLDHTPNSNYGYCMLFNTTSGMGKLLFVDTLRANLCEGSLYQFSAWMINAAVPSRCALSSPVFPSFSLIVEDLSGNVLAQNYTGPMPYDYNMERTPKFHFENVDFVLPAGIQSVVLKIKCISSGDTPCEFPFAIDDIQFAAKGPGDTIQFAGQPANFVLQSVCYQQNKAITLNGTVDAFYPSTAYQWQQSRDSGLTWTDIPGATQLNYTKICSVPDTLLFRLTAGEPAKMGNMNCRVVSNSVKIEVDGIPPNVSASNNTPICADSIVRFKATGGNEYDWYGPHNYYNNIAEPAIYHATAADTGMYYVTIKTVGGCKAYDSTYVIIRGSVAHAWPFTSSICMGDPVQLNSSDGVAYQWLPQQGLSDATIRSPLASPATSTVYSVRITDSSGCSDTAQVEISLRNSKEVKAGITGSEFVCMPYDSVFLYNTSSGNLTHWQWNFGNGSNAITENVPVQFYNSNGTQSFYTVTLAVADTLGCADTAYHRIKVVDNCYIAVPSAFTPNGDGLNDYLYPVNAYKATELRFRIFNRKGVLIFETKDWTQKWDGTYRGEPQDPGNYVWILEYSIMNDKKVYLKGNTILIR